MMRRTVRSAPRPPGPRVGCWRAAADQGADGGAHDDVGLDPVFPERVNDADMGKTARRAAAENSPIDGRAAFLRMGLGPTLTIVTASSFPAANKALQSSMIRREG